VGQRNYLDGNVFPKEAVHRYVCNRGIRTATRGGSISWELESLMAIPLGTANAVSIALGLSIQQGRSAFQLNILCQPFQVFGVSVYKYA
jgi:hypothetical protein